MKRIPNFLLLLCCIAISHNSQAFCGFYVAKADAKLFNQASQVILVRDNNKTTITMSNDFQGDVKDFAMVVPVPVVLKESDIRIAEQSVFDAIDAYSGPRLVEYYDQNPCQRYAIENMSIAAPTSAKMQFDKDEDIKEKKKESVTIEATYTVGEYDILILSAKESVGLELWLTENGYKIPQGAERVLQPYVLSNMKFFVVKVNLEKHKSSAYQNLRPLQISFESPKFMLPIRLGMANANGNAQDLIIYSLTKNGRVETTNYRTVKVKTDKNVPEFIKDSFGKFYKDLFNKQWKEESDVSYLEYAWDLSSSNYMHCDPCSSNPPSGDMLRKSGVSWLQDRGNNYSVSSDYVGEVFFTRLHVRYNLQNFPQDLQFIETKNKENFQCRYVLQHPASNVDCEQAYDYYKQVYERRNKELYELAALTNWDIGDFSYYPKAYKNAMNDIKPEPRKKKVNKGSMSLDESLPFQIDSSLLLIFFLSFVILFLLKIKS